MSPAVAWDYLSSPMYRNLLIGSSRQEVKDLVAGRVGVGSSYICHHGDRVTPQRIIEWEPFRRIVTEDGVPGSWMGKTLVVYQLEETPSGTHLRSDLGGHEDRPLWVRAILRLAAFFVKRKQQHAIDEFITATTKDHQQRTESRIATSVLP